MANRDHRQPARKNISAILAISVPEKAGQDALSSSQQQNLDMQAKLVTWDLLRMYRTADGEEPNPAMFEPSVRPAFPHRLHSSGK